MRHTAAVTELKIGWVAVPRLSVVLTGVCTPQSVRR